jgi:phosphatidylglycerophosphatase C
MTGDLHEGPPLVAFDFDGTLTVRDSFTAFLKWRVSPARHFAAWCA